MLAGDKNGKGVCGASNIIKKNKNKSKVKIWHDLEYVNVAIYCSSICVHAQRRSPHVSLAKMNYYA